MNDVISPTGKDGADRFYVMDLEDFNNGMNYYWFQESAFGGGADYVTSTAFGAGITNTEKMIEKWDNVEYGSKNDYDMWGVIKEKVKKGWFIPSMGEWVAYGGNLKAFVRRGYGEGLSGSYWSSSSYAAGYAYYADFGREMIYGGSNNNSMKLRLSKTF